MQHAPTVHREQLKITERNAQRLGKTCAQLNANPSDLVNTALGIFFDRIDARIGEASIDSIAAILIERAQGPAPEPPADKPQDPDDIDNRSFEEKREALRAELAGEGNVAPPAAEGSHADPPAEGEVAA